MVQAAAENQLREQRAELTSTKYPRREILELKAVFDEYDVDRSGSLDKAELKKALIRQKRDAQRHDGRKKTLAERQAEAGMVRGADGRGREGVWISDFAEGLFKALDTDKNGRVEFVELVRLMHPLANDAEVATILSWVAPAPETVQPREALTSEQREEIRSVFNLFDRNRDGKISRDEFHKAMRRNENGADALLDQETLDEIFNSIGQADSNGYVELEEWSEHMRESYFAPPLTSASLGTTRRGRQS